jgi:hypothetical protein
MSKIVPSDSKGFLVTPSAALPSNSFVFSILRVTPFVSALWRGGCTANA